MLAGHYDTVPAQENIPGRIEDGAVHGLGASDMKGGLAVMLELARELEDADRAELDVALLAFGKEELPAEFSPLPHLFDSSRVVHEAELAILLEPTDCTIQAGCLGNLNARITFHGVSGHSARPWTAENAIDKALEGLRPYAAIEPRPVEIGGLTFTEVASVTQIEGGIATNVIPDRVVANVNFRYAPDRSPSSADAYLRSLVPEGATYEHAGDSPPARVVTDSPLVQRPARGRRPGARAEAGVDERRRLHLARNRRRSTSAQGRRATPTAATSRSRSPRWSGASGRSGRSSRVASERARLPHPRAADDVSVRAPERGGAARRGARDTR